MSFHKVAAMSRLTAQQILSVKDSMSAAKTFLHLGLPTVNQILYESDFDKLPKESLVAQAWRWEASVPGHSVRHLKAPYMAAAAQRWKEAGHEGVSSVHF
jgi:hypothetical protein